MDLAFLGDLDNFIFFHSCFNLLEVFVMTMDLTFVVRYAYLSLVSENTTKNTEAFQLH